MKCQRQCKTRPDLTRQCQTLKDEARPYKARPGLTRQGKARPDLNRRGQTLPGEARPYKEPAGPGCLYVGCLVYRVIVVVVILVTLLRVGLHLPVRAQVHLDQGSGATSDTAGSKGAKSITNAPPL